MNRRSVLLATGVAALGSLSGCLGTETDDRDGEDGDGTSDPDTEPLLEDEPDPDGEYVVQGPEGRFSARGPLNTDLDGVAIHGYDLVAYFESERPVEGSIDHEYEYRGATFRFDSTAHRETFADNPEAYLPAFGGYCSLGVGNGYKDGMHPEAFDIIDGNLYFNLTPEIHEGWLRNHEERIESGEANWPEIRDSTDPMHIGPGIQ